MRLGMKSISVDRAREELGRPVDQVVQSDAPIMIPGARANAVLVSDDQWRGVQETLYLLSIPGMRESILEGLAAPLEECADEPGW
jgi:antitoxin YefM